MTYFYYDYFIQGFTSCVTKWKTPHCVTKFKTHQSVLICVHLLRFELRSNPVYDF